MWCCIRHFPARNEHTVDFSVRQTQQQNCTKSYTIRTQPGDNDRTLYSVYKHVPRTTRILALFRGICLQFIEERVLSTTTIYDNWWRTPHSNARHARNHPFCQKQLIDLDLLSRIAGGWVYIVGGFPSRCLLGLYIMRIRLCLIVYINLIWVIIIK